MNREAHVTSNDRMLSLSKEKLNCMQKLMQSHTFHAKDHTYSTF